MLATAVLLFPLETSRETAAGDGSAECNGALVSFARSSRSTHGIEYMQIEFIETVTDGIGGSQLTGRKRKLVLGCGVGYLALLWTGGMLLGETVLVGQAVDAARRVAMSEVRHDAWSGLLGKYVDQDGLVDYSAWRKSAADMSALDAYLELLSTARVVEPSKEVKLAFWINAYNAITLRGILREYPTSSIRNHTAKLWGYNIWKNLKLQIDGQQFSLEHIEHEILRKLGDPRIHFAIVCASMGCPRLLNEAYEEQKIDLQLAKNSKAFFADSRKFRFDVARESVEVSPILSWFAEDFGNDQSARLQTIRPWVPQAAQALLSQTQVKVSYLGYDWSLNDQKSRRR